MSIVSISPAATWLVIGGSGAQSLRLSGTANVPGSTTVRVRATDGNGAFVEKDIVLQTQNNLAPVVTQSFGLQYAVPGRAFSFDKPLAQVFSDGNADLLSISASLTSGAALPSWLSFESIDNPPTLRLVGMRKKGVRLGYPR